jgi:hypothetical protein
MIQVLHNYIHEEMHTTSSFAILRELDHFRRLNGGTEYEKEMDSMKNGVFWDVTPYGSCKNRRFGGT